MPNTYVALRTETVAVSTASVTLNLSGISGYTDLVLVSNVRINQSASSDIYCQPNGVGTANKGFTFLIGNGSTITSNRGSNDANIRIGAGTGTSQASGIFGTSITNFMNYSNTTTFKTILSRGSDATNATQAIVGLFPSNNAITSIVIYGNSGVNILEGSTFSLYGISNVGEATPKATGGIVTSDATYWYHTFAMSGNFTPNQSLTCDYLVVAGGGGGGGVFNASGVGAGGGAGGYRTSIGGSPLTLTASTTYSAIVGAGGTGGPGQTPVATNGIDSVFATITSTGGGFGNSTQSAQSGNGGSGGGGSSSTSGIGSGNTPSTSPSQGNNGGAGIATGNFPSGGGGGAGAVGGNASTSVGGVGGAGVANSISGTSVTYAGGGGGGIYNSGTGGAGGAGGGGAAGAPGLPGTSGTANTGGGGGGASSAVSGGTDAGGNGGSGIIIVRYLKA